VGSAQGVYKRFLTTVHARLHIRDGQKSILKAEAGMKEERSENSAGNATDS